MANHLDNVVARGRSEIFAGDRKVVGIVHVVPINGIRRNGIDAHLHDLVRLHLQFAGNGQFLRIDRDDDEVAAGIKMIFWDFESNRVAVGSYRCVQRNALVAFAL